MRFKFILLTCILILLANALSASAEVRWTGQVYMDGYLAADGIPVTTWADCYGTGLAQVYSWNTNLGFGYYESHIPMDDPLTSGADEGCVQGQVIYLRVDSIPTYNPISLTLPIDGTSTNGYNIFSMIPLLLDEVLNNTYSSSTTPGFNWTGATPAGRTYDLIIDTDSNFNTPLTLNQSNISDLDYTLTAGQALADGTFYWKIDAINNGSYFNSSGVNNFIIDLTPPVITLVSPGNNSWNDSSIDVTVTTDENGYCAYGTASGAFGSKTLMSGTTTLHTATITLSIEGNNNIYFQCNDSRNNINSERLYVYQRDTLDPSVASAVIDIENGAENQSNRTISFNWTGFADPDSGIRGYYYSFTNGQQTTAGTYTTLTSAIATAAVDGLVTMYVWAVDIVGNIGNAVSDSIIVDLLDPVISFGVTSPVILDETYAGNLVVYADVTDAGIGLNATPQLQYKRGLFDASYTSYADMILQAGDTYFFTIPVPGIDWTVITGENVTYNVQAVDKFGRSTIASSYKTVTQESYPPVFDPISDAIINEDQLYWFMISATDQDGDTLTITSNFSELTLTRYNTTAFNVSWTPEQDDVGVNLVVFTATDGAFYVNSSIVSITVINANDPPVISPTNPQSGYVHDEFYLKIIAIDEENDSLSFYSSSQVFRINSTTGEINFTPLSSHEGQHNFTITVSDGIATDIINVTVTIYFCGDGICNTYESCSICALDCGSCSAEPVDRMAILVDQRNCINELMNISVYQLWSRATCESMGFIIERYEICGNLSGVSLTVQIEDTEGWNNSGEYVTDQFGKTSFTPLILGNYRLLGKKSGYPETYEYFEIDTCIKEDIVNETTARTQNLTPLIENKTQTPEKTPDEEQPDLIPDEEQSRLLFIVYYLIIPVLTISLASTSSYFYYREKDNNKRLLLARIFVKKNTKILKLYIRYYLLKFLKFFKIGLNK